ncbi:MAG TPA: bifunctional adenosylcobinamide kinase/adenosylcobinamide-phosphate guanylyltransferase [Xanthobacteraceae bacterium]|nr:bifunctional adenosylcobinamide kinase/adenosylcobinamide-phosphate guanylyltransferase [Xanthobacteraceae bacterium]
MSLAFVLGGTRSGKSRHAEARVQAHAPPWTYIATAEAGDHEMAARIALHRARRGNGWETLDAPHQLASALRNLPAGRPVLVDCLTLWLSNRMLAGTDLAMETAVLVTALIAHDGPLVVVSNEVGLGIVPDNALARRFRDAQGRLNQQVAELADEVVFMVAGLPMKVKP